MGEFVALLGPFDLFLVEEYSHQMIPVEFEIALVVAVPSTREINRVVNLTFLSQRSHTVLGFPNLRWRNGLDGVAGLVEQEHMILERHASNSL